MEGVGAQFKGSNFAIWQPWDEEEEEEEGKRSHGQVERESKKLFETHDYDKSAAAGLLLLRLVLLFLLPFHCSQRVGCHCVFQCLTVKQRS